MQNACGKNPSFPWCTWQPEATLGIQFHQPTGLQHSAWCILVNKLYRPQFVWHFPAIWGCGWHDRIAKKCYSAPLSCSGCAYLHKNLHSLDFYSFSDHAIYDSTATHFWFCHQKKKKPKNPSVNWSYWNILPVSSCSISCSKALPTCWELM